METQPIERDAFLRRVWLTKNARFRATKRLEQYHLWCNWFITIYSSAILLMSVANTSGIFQEKGSFLTFGILSASFLVLIFSLLLGGYDFSAQAVKMHFCALKLAELHDKIKLSDSNEAHIQSYNDILQGYENHIELDHYEALCDSDEVTCAYKFKFYRLKIKSLFPFMLALIPLPLLYIYIK